MSNEEQKNEWSDISPSVKNSILAIFNSIPDEKPVVSVEADVSDEAQDAISEQAFKAADNLIVRIKNFNGLDYSSKREEIANEFDTVLWDGNYDTTLHFDNIQSIRLIQEDEYDQHMDDDEKPNVDFLAGDHYVIFLD